LLNDVPEGLKNICGETIGAMGFVFGHFRNSCFNLFHGERYEEKVVLLLGDQYGYVLGNLPNIYSYVPDGLG